MNRTLLIATFLLLAPSVRAADDPDAAFQELASREAKDGNEYVSEWWSANLDNDPALEHVAVLCPNDKDDHKGYFLIDKDPTHRWELTFDFDSRTDKCKGKPATPPKMEQRKTNAIELRQDHLKGYEITWYALRVGQVVIVKEETSDGGKPEVKDWDQLIKKKKAKAYQAPENLRPLNP